MLYQWIQHVCTNFSRKVNCGDLAIVVGLEFRCLSFQKKTRAAGSPKNRSKLNLIDPDWFERPTSLALQNFRVVSCPL